MNEAYNMDCLDFMRTLPDNAFDLCIADPPYGRKEDGGKNRSGFVRQKNGARLFVPDGGYQKSYWDRKPPSEEMLREIFRVSKVKSKKNTAVRAYAIQHRLIASSAKLQKL